MILRFGKKGKALLKLRVRFVVLLIIIVGEVIFYKLQIRHYFPSDYYSLIVESLLVLLLILLPFVVFSIVGSVDWRWRCVVQLIHVCIFLGACSFVYLIMPHESYSGFLNGVQGGFILLMSCGSFIF